MIELKLFIEQSLVEIAEAIVGANAQLKDLGAFVNPLDVIRTSDENHGRLERYKPSEAAP